MLRKLRKCFLHCLAYFQEKYSCKANFTIATFHLFWTFSLEEFQSISIWFKYLLQLSDIFLLKERLNATTVVRQPIRAAGGKCILKRLVTNAVLIIFRVFQDGNRRTRCEEEKILLKTRNCSKTWGIWKQCSEGS